MKKLVALVRPHTLERVKDALAQIGVKGMTVSECRGFGRSAGKAELYRGATYVVALIPKIKIEIAIPESLIEEAVECILAAARTGQIGDGKIFVETLPEAIRIRTGESGEDAL